MKIHSVSPVHHPQERVYRTYRDRLREIAPYIPDIKEITVRSREEGDGSVRQHNRWVARREIPRMLQVVVKPEMLCWDDIATWKDAEFCCDWVLRLRVFTESVHCRGTNWFRAEGPGRCRVVLEGDLDIALDRMPGVPSIVARRIGPQVERFFVSLITPNLERVNQSLERFLDDQA